MIVLHRQIVAIDLRVLVVRHCAASLSICDCYRLSRLDLEEEALTLGLTNPFQQGIVGNQYARDENLYPSSHSVLEEG